jgi:hypothetical protein
MYRAFVSKTPNSPPTQGGNDINVGDLPSTIPQQGPLGSSSLFKRKSKAPSARKVMQTTDLHGSAAQPPVSIASTTGLEAGGPDDLVQMKLEQRKPETWAKKADDELQIVWGEVYVPDIPDSQGDYMTAIEIRKMAYQFMANGNVEQIDVNHDNKLYGCYVVESFIARSDDTTFIPGSWVMGVHVPDLAIWSAIKSGELNGFSLQALTLGEDKEIEIEVPPQITGQTENTDGHTHTFSVAFSDDARFLGGMTGLIDGHTHQIKKGTITEPGGKDGHVHRFAFLDEFVHAQNPS